MTALQRDDELTHVAIDAATQTHLIDHVVRNGTHPLGVTVGAAHTATAFPMWMRSLLMFSFNERRGFLDETLLVDELGHAQIIDHYLTIAAVRSLRPHRMTGIRQFRNEIPETPLRLFTQGVPDGHVRSGLWGRVRPTAPPIAMTPRGRVSRKRLYGKETHKKPKSKKARAATAARPTKKATRRCAATSATAGAFTNMPVPASALASAAAFTAARRDREPSGESDDPFDELFAPRIERPEPASRRDVAKVTKLPVKRHAAAMSGKTVSRGAQRGESETAWLEGDEVTKLKYMPSTSRDAATNIPSQSLIERDEEAHLFEDEEAEDEDEDEEDEDDEDDDEDEEYPFWEDVDVDENVVDDVAATAEPEIATEANDTWGRKTNRERRPSSAKAARQRAPLSSRRDAANDFAPCTDHHPSI